MNDQHRHTLFHRWAEEYRSLLYKVVRSYTTNLANQQDLLQEISLQLWRSTAYFRAEAKASTWVYRIALNTAISWSTRISRQAKQAKEMPPPSPTVASTEVDERLEWLYAEINLLHEIDRSLCLLMLDGFSYREMSQILGISTSNVGVKINRIKKRLSERSQQVKNYGIQ
ncbi:MAG: RNA polymerase sigma factor [Bacteroidota bacterium]